MSARRGGSARPVGVQRLHYGMAIDVEGMFEVADSGPSA
jgi:hypothetical protein